MNWLVSKIGSGLLLARQLFDHAITKQEQMINDGNDAVLFRFRRHGNMQVLDPGDVNVLHRHANCCFSHSALKAWALNDIGEETIAEEVREEAD